MSSLQLLTSWTRDVDHRADTGFCWTDHSKHDCRTRDRCKATGYCYCWRVYNITSHIKQINNVLCFWYDELNPAIKMKLLISYC